jgi:predicted unusual protein kinase regulating ubiquinone biosynthesis (AarF/ABC1/UbiB family)
MVSASFHSANSKGRSSDLAAGVASAPHRAASWDAAEQHARSLALSLRTLGPLFCAFGRSLSVRVDLLPLAVRSALAELPDPDPAPAFAIRAVFERETGVCLERTCAGFSDLPCETGLLTQAHRAVLLNGRPVAIRTWRPDAGQIMEQSELLPLLRDTFKDISEREFDRAIAMFRRKLSQELDLAAHLRILTALAEETRDIGSLAFPRVIEHLSGARVLTMVEPPGLPLTRLPERGGEPEIARLLATAWLRQALCGSAYPARLTAENVLVGDHQISLTASAFDTLPESSQTNLWQYLLAVETGDTDKACGCLIHEMENEDDLRKSDELFRLFRQTVPFRDADWDPRHARTASSLSDVSAIADQVAVHWKFAANVGYRMPERLLSFYSAFSTMAGLAAALAPDRDSISEAVRDLRLIFGFDEMQAMFRPSQLASLVGDYSRTFFQFPQEMNAFLERTHRPDPVGRPDGGAPRTSGGPVLTASLLLVFAALTLLLRDAGSWLQAHFAIKDLLPLGLLLAGLLWLGKVLDQ